MSELILTRDERLALRARAHHLNPVVMLGAAGLTEAVFKETDRALAGHELIKVRVPGDDREEREAICAQLADRLGAARVQVIGKVLVLFRPRPEDEAPAKPPAPGRATRAAAPRAAPARSRADSRVPRTLPRRSSGRGR